MAKKNTSEAASVTSEHIAARAYEFYELEGRLDGRDIEHWLRAENELKANRPNASSNPSGRKQVVP